MDGNSNGRVKVGGGGSGPIVRWADFHAGDSLDGTYGGMLDGKFGKLAQLGTTEGIIQLPVLTALTAKLARVRVGAHVEVVYLGMKKNAKSGREYRDFDVFVQSTSDLIPVKGGDDTSGPA